MEERICVHCGCVIEGEGYWVGSDVLCDDCASELTAICCDCDERFYVADDCGDSWRFLCRSCYEGNYTRCERCCEAIRCDEAFRVSEGCYEGDDLCESCYTQRLRLCIATTTTTAMQSIMRTLLSLLSGWDLQRTTSVTCGILDTP